MAPSTVCIRETLADRLPKPVIAPSASLSKKASDASVPTPVMLPEINIGSLKSAVAVSVPVPVISAEKQSLHRWWWTAKYRHLGYTLENLCFQKGLSLLT
jgi:hypothetical protein